MALSFAVITEGVSEYSIIKHIIQHYLTEDPIVRRLQPLVDTNGHQIGTGGWNEVLKYCTQNDCLQSALEHNDYIVVQIDTDMCETAPFSVSRVAEGGGQVSYEILLQRVKQRLLDEISDTIDISKFIFAICVEEAECWLLPAVCTRENKKNATKNCCNRVNFELARLGVPTIVEKNSPQANRSYAYLLSKMKKKRDIQNAASYHLGFNLFLAQLTSAESKIATLNEP